MEEKENGGVGQGPKEVVELDGSGFFVGWVEEVVDPGYHFVVFDLVLKCTCAL